MAGTTYQNVGGDYVVDGAVEKGNRMTGHIGGAIKATSRQDTATYDGKQTNAGFNVDVDLVKHGAGSSLSVNGGRTKVNADYAAVTEQTGLQYQSSDVVVEGKSTFKGAYFTTATPEANKTQFRGGLEVSDIENHSQYKADGINAGLSAETGQKPKVSGVGYGKDGDSQASTTYGAVTGVAGKSEVTIANVETLNKSLANNFDKDKVNAEIGAQVQITQEYGKEIPKVIGDYAKEKTKRYEYAQMVEGQLNDKLNSTTDPVQRQLILEDLQKVEAFKQAHEQDYNNWKEGGAYRVMAHTAAGALGSGSLQGAAFSGGVAAAAPKINELESKFTEKLIEQGMNPTVAQGLASGLSSATIAGVSNSAGLGTNSIATAVNMDANNRQLHPSERAWITKNTHDFALKMGISDVEAEKRLAQEAARQTDLLWMLALPKGTDTAAANFLASSNGYFTNELGGKQKFFTAVNSDFIRPEEYALDTDQAFNNRNLISKQNSNIIQGLNQVANNTASDVKKY